VPKLLSLFTRYQLWPAIYSVLSRFILSHDFLSQAQNETNVVFVPRAFKDFDEAGMLGEIIISGQHGTTSPTKTQNQTVVSRGLVQTGNGSEQISIDGPGDPQDPAALEDIDMKSWGAMSSQKRSKVCVLL